VNRCKGELPLFGLCYNSDRYSPHETPFLSSHRVSKEESSTVARSPLFFPSDLTYGGDMPYTAERQFRPNPGKLTGRGLKAKALASGVAYVQCPSSVLDVSFREA
jgi:hypothetical protein